jgi:hypothetical protein
MLCEPAHRPCVAARALPNSMCRLRRNRETSQSVTQPIILLPTRIIANTLPCKSEEIVRKLGEGGLNHTFLIILDTGFQLVAHPIFHPNSPGIRSCHRSRYHGLPSFQRDSLMSENEAETKYILMEYVKGTDCQIWFNLEEDEIILLIDSV